MKLPCDHNICLDCAKKEYHPQTSEIVCPFDKKASFLTELDDLPVDETIYEQLQDPEAGTAAPPVGEEEDVVAWKSYINNEVVLK